MPSRIRLSVLSTATALVLAGCGAGAPPAPAAPSAPTAPADSAPAPAATAPAQTGLPAATAPAPSPESVLTAITDIDGGGALSYDVENGSKIHYWHGLEFEADGKRYYTGFAWFTPTKYGADRTSGRIDPAAKVVLAHATYQASAPGAQTPWTWLGSEPYIGEFGHAEQGNAIDTTRKPQTFTAPSGQLVLALPSTLAGDGGASPAYEVLVFNPHELKETKDRKWRYVGTLPAGSGTAAAPLAMVAVPGADLPALQVGGGGNGAGGDKPTEYRYDLAHNTYRPISR
ncbi:hypothetical protein [Stenotrophomonas sp.]|uniref:hypothetical protein n=1 Tax=Stenotrophomonas sp. TaxID=69392 RepID=UPI002FC610F0